MDFWDGGGNLQLRIWTKEKKFGNWDFSGGGVICNFGFGLRGFLGWGGNLQKIGDFWMGGGNLQLRIFRKKVGNSDFWGGVICNFGFGLRKKSWKLGFLGWGG